MAQKNLMQVSSILIINSTEVRDYFTAEPLRFSDPLTFVERRALSSLKWICTLTSIIRRQQKQIEFIADKAFKWHGGFM